MNAPAPITALTPHQQAAYDQLRPLLVDSGRMAVLEGYAGCGKTFMVGRLVADAVQRGLKVAVAAPTNKAVSVLAAKVIEAQGNAEAATVQSLLGLRLIEKEDGTTSLEPDGIPSLGEYDLVIVDECSMICHKLLQAIAQCRGGCTVIFVGDPAQLPPVGLWDASPVFRDVQFKVRLSEVVRQAAGNPIIRMTMAIRQAIEEGRRVTLDDLTAALPSDNATVWISDGTEQDITALAIVENQAGTDCRVVAYRNQSVLRYNQVIHRALHSSSLGFSPGERVIAQQEFKTRGENRQRVFTSEEMTLLAIDPDPGEHFGIPAMTATLQRPGGEPVHALIPANPTIYAAMMKARWSKYRNLKRAESTTRDHAQRVSLATEMRELSRENMAISRSFADIRHTYATTAHKAQGSTYHTVAVDWRDLSRMPSDFEFNRALYVACTRASHHLAVIA